MSSSSRVPSQPALRRRQKALSVAGPAGLYNRAMGRYLWALPNTLLGLAFWPSVFVGRGGWQMVDGVLELHGPVIAWFLGRCVLLPGGAAAMTLGHVVIGRDARTLAMTRVHERVHVRQYEQWGPAFIPAYGAAALWGLMTGGGAYSGNIFERTALQAESEVRIHAHASAHDGVIPRV
jgi:hypothetical protein